ncbi:MAG: hypothetical protein M5U26_11140 [Planctomycetota bacterium]|nr:hypothetical protein [Planctomycetota bacterium]
MREDPITKHRPKAFEDFWGQDEGIAATRQFLISNALPSPLLRAHHRETAFFFCSTRRDKLDGAILARSHCYEMSLPAETEVVTDLLRIAGLEGISLTSEKAWEIAKNRNRVPRECLKDLQALVGTGKIRGRAKSRSQG